MTRAAIARLQRDPEGYLLVVEGGRIDHAHHATNPARALADVLALDDAVRVAREMSSREDTLIIVTADHSHVLTMAGYPTRGNPILGKVVGLDERGEPRSSPTTDLDGRPYPTLGYLNGLGFAELPGAGSADAIYALARSEPDALVRGWVDLAAVDTIDEGFHPPTLVPLPGETHGGEDVALYADGPGAALFQGVIEQHVVYHVMNHAAGLARRAGLERLEP
jgi:alkaline phosphatase